MATSDVWRYIGSERSDLADTWESLTPEQWSAMSWCEGWSIQDVPGHLVASAEQTPRTYQRVGGGRLNFNVFAERGAKRCASAGSTSLFDASVLEPQRGITHRVPPTPCSEKSSCTATVFDDRSVSPTDPLSPPS